MRLCESLSYVCIGSDDPTRYSVSQMQAKPAQQTLVSYADLWYFTRAFAIQGILLDCRLLHVCACAASSLQQCCAQHVSWGGENMCFAVRHQREPNSALTWVLILMCRGACPAGVRCDHEPDTRRPRGSVRTSGYLGARGGPASVADSAAKNSKRKFCPRCYKMHTRAHT